MFKYDDNSGRITFKLKFSFSPRSWWGHTKYWIEYLTSKKKREFVKKRREAFEEVSKKIWREAEFLAIWGMTEEEFKKKYE